jgi:hypothetical protein
MNLNRNKTDNQPTVISCWTKSYKVLHDDMYAQSINLDKTIGLNYLLIKGSFLKYLFKNILDRSFLHIRYVWT